MEIFKARGCVIVMFQIHSQLLSRAKKVKTTCTSKVKYSYSSPSKLRSHSENLAWLLGPGFIVCFAAFVDVPSLFCRQG
jgi:hypothetical protein